MRYDCQTHINLTAPEELGLSLAGVHLTADSSRINTCKYTYLDISYKSEIRYNAEIRYLAETSGNAEMSYHVEIRYLAKLKKSYKNRGKK